MLSSSILRWSIVAIAVLVVAFALADLVLARRDRRRWAELDDDAVTRRAAERVVAARAAMTEAVDAHETALRLSPTRSTSISTTSGVEGAGGDQPTDSGPDTDHDSHAELASARDRAREALLDAQRLWEVVRPANDTPVRLALWAGRGRLRAWQLGPIGFERVLLRCDHLLDPSCWELSEHRRIRFGFGLGVESLSVAFFAVRAPSRRLDELVGSALSGPEVALRPGTSLVRWWRRRRRSERAAAATDALLADRALERAPARETVSALSAAIEEEFGATALKAGLPQLARPTAYTHTAGPSLLAGIWWGPRPSRTRCAASTHLVWRDRP